MIKGHHYKFDPESLQYDKVKQSRKKKFFKIFFTQIGTAIVIAVILFISFSYLLESPEQKRLKVENNQLQNEYGQLSERYEQTQKVLADVQQRDDNIYRSIFESEPVHYNSLHGYDYDPYQQFEGLESRDIVEETTSRLLKSKRLLNAQEKAYNDLVQIFLSKKAILGNIPSIQPLPNKDLQYIPYGFGKRIDPVYKTPAFHYGMDFAAPKGTEVYATADGVVLRADEFMRGWGKFVRIMHGNGYETLYSHLNEMVVGPGRNVKRGDLIGYVGNTGKNFVSHLHYEVIFNGKQVNPVNFFFQDLSPDKLSRMVELASRGGLSLD
jgi:murein DD-endopeptidase MepM/ murein hydrolase activator NlpD